MTYKLRSAYARVAGKEVPLLPTDDDVPTVADVHRALRDRLQKYAAGGFLRPTPLEPNADEPLRASGTTVRHVTTKQLTEAATRGHARPCAITGCVALHADGSRMHIDADGATVHTIQRSQLDIADGQWLDTVSRYVFDRTRNPDVWPDDKWREWVRTSAIKAGIYEDDLAAGGPFLALPPGQTVVYGAAGGGGSFDNAKAACGGGGGGESSPRHIGLAVENAARGSGVQVVLQGRSVCAYMVARRHILANEWVTADDVKTVQEARTRMRGDWPAGKPQTLAESLDAVAHALYGDQCAICGTVNATGKVATGDMRCNLHRGASLPPLPSPPGGPVVCDLPWCKSVSVGARYCSDRCRDYDVKRLAIDMKRLVFMRKWLTVSPLPPELRGERDWADRMCDEETAVLERQFHSLRVEP